MWGQGPIGSITTTPQASPAVVPALADKDVCFVSTGKHHSAAVCSDGEVYTWGTKGKNGQLGHGDFDKAQEPRLLDIICDAEIVGISCGDFHTVAVGRLGEVYSWGWGGSHLKGSMLGNGGHDDGPVPTMVESLAQEGHVVTEVHCGAEHTVVLTDEGQMWSWGGGARGKLGQMSNSDYDQPTPIAMQQPVTQLSVSAIHNACLTDTGEAWVWGSNEHSQLGYVPDGYSLPQHEASLVPRLVPLPEPAKQVACGEHVTAFLLESGRVFVCGWKSHHTPVDLGALSEMPPNLTHISCGLTHMLFQTEEGALYSYGKGAQLGQGEHRQRWKIAPVEGMEGVIASTCGSTTSAAIQRVAAEPPSEL